MTLGVSVSCMPAFSHMLHNNLPWYKTLRSRFRSQLSRSKRSHLKDTPDVRFNYQDSEQSAKHQDLITAQVVKQPSVSLELDLGRVRPVKTYISSGKRGQVDDGVHLKYELTQVSHESSQDLDGSAHHQSEPRASNSRETRGLDMV